MSEMEKLQHLILHFNDIQLFQSQYFSYTESRRCTNCTNSFIQEQNLSIGINIQIHYKFMFQVPITEQNRYEFERKVAKLTKEINQLKIEDQE